MTVVRGGEDAAARLTPEARRKLVLQRVISGGGDIGQLAAELGISTATVRRDLRRLTEEGLVARTYGGAIVQPRQAELTLHEKEAAHVPEKEAIARAAAEHVADGALVFLDAGTTVGALARRLASRGGLTILTGSLNSIATLTRAEENRLIVIGGEVRLSSQGMTGSIAETTLRQVSPDVAFIGAEGLVAGRGICCPTLEQCSIKSLAMRQARRAYILADASKLGAAAFNYWAAAPPGVALITDAGAPADAVAGFADLTVEIASS